MQFWCSSLILQSWRWCLRCGSVVVSSKGKNKVNQNCRKQTRKNLTKCPKFKCNTVSVSFSACRCSSVVVSSKVGREKWKEKKKSLEIVLWMAICSCGSPACCCQPAVAGGFIYADPWGELSTHLAPQALFTQSSPLCDATATSFPLSKHSGGGDTIPTFSGRHVCLQLTWEVGLPPLLWSFPPTTAFTSFPAPGCWARTPASTLSAGPACLFTFLWGIPLPHSVVLRVLHLLC
jgi:hypothetical protein